MNRPLDCAAALLLMMLVAVPARAQVPLVVGSVRDRQGAPIEGALVRGETATGAALTATTDAAGTFALEAPGVVSLFVTCRYCEPTRVPANPGEPIVAIVRRYQALAQDSLTTADLQSLPYAHVEQSLALQPFMLLAQSSAAYPGSRLSDRGLSSSGSLLIDNGAANYDIAAGQSPYVFVPASYQQGAAFQSASNAYLYGDRAGGGVVELAPFVNGYSSEVATGGSNVVGRVQAGSDAASVVAGSFSNDEESRQRADFLTNWNVGDAQSLTFAGGSEQTHLFETPVTSVFAGSFTFADATYTNARLLNLTLSTVADRGNYAMNLGDYPINSEWSDSAFSAGIHSTGPISVFANLDVRSSTGIYDAQALHFVTIPRIGAMFSQTKLDAGFEARGNDYDVTAGVGTFWINYTGGTNGISNPAGVALAEPSFQAELFQNRKFSFNFQDSGSFTLPTFLEQYGNAAVSPIPLAYQRNALVSGALTYTDGSRVRVSFEDASESVQGSTTGTVSSAGVSATWQLAPAIALRAWTMHVADTVNIQGLVPPYGGVAPTVNALWLTYDNGSALRVDAIYRRDLLNSAPFYHIDGSISGPVANRLRWYAGGYDWLHRSFIEIGLRFAGR